MISSFWIMELQKTKAFAYSMLHKKDDLVILLNLQEKTYTEVSF